MVAAKHIIFDLDGTLIDSKREILKTYSKVFEQYPPEHGVDLERLNYGLSIKDLLSEVYKGDTQKILPAKDAFALEYDTSDYTETLLYPGVMDTLEQLYRNNWKMHIATNKRHYPTLRILEQKKIIQYFTAVVGNEVKPGIFMPKQQMIADIKQSESFSGGYMVGDSVSDIVGGQREGLQTIAVTYGYEDALAIMESGANYIVDYFPGILTVVKLL